MAEDRMVTVWSEHSPSTRLNGEAGEGLADRLLVSLIVLSQTTSESDRRPSMICPEYSGEKAYHEVHPQRCGGVATIPETRIVRGQNLGYQTQLGWPLSWLTPSP